MAEACANLDALAALPDGPHLDATRRRRLDVSLADGSSSTERNSLPARIRKRDRHFCQVLGCSRPAVHAHHIEPRSRGGSDDPWNLVSLCAAHHLLGIRGGRMRVTGAAPDKLRWELVAREGSAVPFS